MDYMDLALQEARLAYEEGEAPIGAILVHQDRVIGRGHNHREKNLDIASHAEIEALRQGAKTLGRWSMEGTTLYVTLEPCLMCAGALLQSRVSTLVYGADNPEDGAISHFGVLTHEKILVYRGEKKKQCEALLQEFFRSLR